MKFDTSKYSRDLRRYYQIPAVQSSLTVVLSIFVVAIFISLALRPTLISIANLKNTISDANKTSQTLKVKVKNLQTASSQLENLKPILPMLNANIPNKGVMYSDFINTVEAIAIQTGSTLDTETMGASLLFSKIASPFELNRDHEVVNLSFTISVTGAYPQLEQFLNTFLSIERLAMVDSLNVAPAVSSKNSNKSGESVLKMDIQGSVFYMADKEQLAKILEEKKGGK